MSARITGIPLASMRAGGALLLLDAQGRILMSQHPADNSCPNLPFGLQCVVEKVIYDSREAFTSGTADVVIEFPLTVRLFSFYKQLQPIIGVYVERACRSTDNHLM